MEVYSAPAGERLAWKSSYEIINAGNSSFFPEGAIFGGRWLQLLDDGENLTSHRPVDRTSAWNPIARAQRSGCL